MIGQQLGSYMIAEMIERSGMVEVYRGYHVEFEQEVAIKVIGRYLEPSPLLNERIRREATTIAQLRHPNIVALYDFGEVGGGHYFVTELIEGETVTDLIAGMNAGTRYIDQDDISFYTRQIASAIDYAHSRNILHRDITPSSILITSSNQAFLAGFGLAVLKARDTEGEGGIPLGTPQYMAPEYAIDAAGVIPKSDTYSLGVILYELTSGVLPFNADSPVELALKHVNETPPPPQQINPTLPFAVSTVIMQAIAKEPTERFDNAMALAKALAHAWKINDNVEVVSLTSGTLEAQDGAELPPVPDGFLSPPPEVEPPPTPPARELPRPPRSRRSIRDLARLRPGRNKSALPVTIIGLAVVLIVLLGIIISSIFGLNVFGFLGGPRDGSAGVADEPLIINTATLPPGQASATPADQTENTQPPSSTEVPLAPEAPIASPPPTVAPLPEAGAQVFRLADAVVMIYVSEGTFLMGSADLARLGSEQPQHEVMLSGYWIDQTEVTIAQYKLCVDSGQCEPPVDTRNYNNPRYANFPVVYVSWELASNYCASIGASTGLSVSLPSEAQWEKASSWDPFTSTKRLYPWGDTAPNASLLRYVESVASLQGAEVGSHPDGASAYGAMDMAGNVWELVYDWYASDYYSLPLTTPDPQGPADGDRRIVRGGAWGWDGASAISTFRNTVSPEAATEDIGFRCVTNATTLTPQNSIAFSSQEALAGAQAAIALAQTQGEGSELTLDDWQALLITMSAQLDSNNLTELVTLIDTRLEAIDAQVETGGLPPDTAATLRRTLRWVRFNVAG